MPQLLRIVGSVVAPTTLLTALLFYFGRLHITGFFGYFGVNFTALDLTVQDYLIRSADGLFVPLTVAAVLGLVLLRLHRLLMTGIPEQRRRRIIRVLRPATACAGIALIGLSAAALLRGDDVLGPVPEVGGLSLAGGVLLIAYAARLASQLRPRGSAGAPGFELAEWFATFVVVSVGLFWAVGSYAIGVGTGRAEQMESLLPSWPDAVLYSEHSLSLHGPGMRETACTAAAAAFGYRYDGLKLVIQSGDQYFFLPAGWTSTDGAALLIPRTDSLRLEFTQPGAPIHRTC